MSENNDAPKQRQKSPYFLRNVAILISGIAGGVLIAVILVVGYGLITADKRMAIGLAHVTQQMSEANNNMAEAQKNATSATQTVQQINDAIKNQAQAIADLQKASRTNKDDFLAAEALYLVKLASDNLQYENNVPLAIKLLQSADQDIAALKDPKAYPIREAFATDLVALQGARQVDVAGIFVRIAALNQQIDKLSFISQLLNRDVVAAAEVSQEKLPWWRRGLKSLEVALQRIVIVRKNAPNIPPFIAPDQRIFLYQNLHNELEKAEWGLLHQKPDIYRLSLLQAMNWIKQYAVPDSPVTAQLVQDLGQLQQIDVHPNVPNLTNSLQALQNYMSSVAR